MSLDDHPLRHQLADELHARPFPTAAAPGWAAFLALMPAREAGRDRDAERAHLVALLDHFGAPHPRPWVTHWYGPLGRDWLKWESHTEFVTYTALGSGEQGRPFDPGLFDALPAGWLSAAPVDRRADLALRLQHTVEGLSVVAISYYAVGLSLYLLGPLAHQVDKAWLGALVTPVVVVAVLLGLRRVRRRLGAGRH